MTKTEFYNQLQTNARMQGYTATNAAGGLLLDTILVRIKYNVVTIIDATTCNVIDITDWNKHFSDNMVAITLDTVIKNM